MSAVAIASLMELDHRVLEAVECFDERWFTSAMSLPREQLAQAFTERDRVEEAFATWRQAFNDELRFIVERGFRDVERAPESQVAFDAVMKVLTKR